MFFHYLILAVRTFARHKLYTAINLVGLTVCMACALLVTLYVRHEMSYNDHFDKADRIYRIGTNIRISESETFSVAGTYVPLGPALENDFPEVETAVRLFPSAGTFRVGDTSQRDLFLWADPKVFDLFEVDVVAGDLERALDQPNTFVLTDRAAQKYFGTTDAVGRTITFNRDRTVEVAAVIKPWPPTTHMTVDLFGSMETAKDIMGGRVFDNWINTGANRTYVLLAEGSDPKVLEAALPAFLKRYTDELFQAAIKLDVTALTDIYLMSDRVDEFPPKGSILQVWVAVCVAALLLLVASLNFIILTLSLARERIMEMGLRKLHGAGQRQVMGQIIGEAVFSLLIAYGVAVSIVDTALPSVAAWMDNGHLLSGALMPVTYTSLASGFPTSVFGEPGVVLSGLSGAVLLGVIVGFGPALVIARARPNSLVGQATSSSGQKSRAGFVLVLAQFAISMALAIIGVAFYQQGQHLRTVDLGFDRENLLIVGEAGFEGTASVHARLKSELTRLPGIVSVSQANKAPTMGSNRSSYSVVGKPKDEPIIAWEAGVDQDYVKTLGMELIAGTDFLPGMKPVAELDSSGTFIGGETPALITEGMVRKLGLTAPEDALGVTLKYAGDFASMSQRIIGVVKPVEFNSGFSESESEVFYLKDSDAWTGRQSKLLVRIAPTNIGDTLAAIDAAWARIEPDYPVQRWFLDERLELYYRQSERLADLFQVGIALAIVVSCMGLFGLAAFSAQRRTKEVGVRKANGATTPQIVRLMTWDLTKPVLWANVIAWPLAYWAVKRGLEFYVLRADISPLLYVGAGLAGLVIAWGVVAVHVIRTARTHPAYALRYE